MKKSICFLLCLTLIFSSVSLSFAAGWSDSQISSVVSDLSTIKTTLNNIYNKVTTISNSLLDSNHSVAYWTSVIASWMQPIYSQLTSGLVSETDIIPIVSGLNEVVSDGTNTSYFPYLKYENKSNANWISDVYKIFNQNIGSASVPIDSMFASNHIYNLWAVGANGTKNTYNINLASRTFTQALSYFIVNLNNNLVDSYLQTWRSAYNGYNSTQTISNWTDIDSSYTFTPSSMTDGLYKYLNSIQAPVARLSYVLASDERIEAQEAAQANEQAVVDNFIDSSGDGAASPSDIGSVSDLSSGYKQNFGTDASPSGIFDIFNSDHATWFSQETKNQLDTTTPTRLSKGSESDTPLLDKQIEDIYNALGVKQP